MKTVIRILWIALFALITGGVFFVVPVQATEQQGEYLGTIGPGETYSTKGVAYAIYQISPTNIEATSGWCHNCYSGNSHTNEEGRRVNSTYSIKVDGFSVLDYSSKAAGEGTIDLSSYSDRDATIVMPADYIVRQTISCVGGESSSGSHISSCGYSRTVSIKVTGMLQLYGYSKVPEVVTNPSSVQAGTDQSAVFTVSGNKVCACRWQRVSPAGIQDLRDETTADGVTYSGTNTMQLTVSGLRLSLSGSSFRCVLIGEKGDEVPTEAAGLTVTDISPPKVKLTYDPSSKTEGAVTIRITASDPDSGLTDKPYHYLDTDNAQNSFKVQKNGTYEVIVRDRAGNSTNANISISNIEAKKPDTPKPTQTPTPAPTHTPTPYPTQTPQPTLTPTPFPTSSPRPTQVPTVPKTEPADPKDKFTPTENEENKKKVNIRNITGGTQTTTEQETDLIEETEEVEEEIVLEEPPAEILEPEAVEESDPIKTVILLCLGILLLLALLFFALLFPVRIENADELGNWHFCALKMLRYRKGWVLNVGLLLEDFDSLRLKFGMLFLAIIGNGSLEVQTDDGKILVKEVSRDLVLHYHQVGRTK